VLHLSSQADNWRHRTPFVITPEALLRYSALGVSRVQMSVNTTSTSSWVFPGPAQNVTLRGGTHYNTDDFNNSITSILRQSAQTTPDEGFGSIRPAYINDAIDIDYNQDPPPSTIERWCLLCTVPDSGESGWDACENCKIPCSYIEI
jgi:hypothetical protein